MAGSHVIHRLAPTELPLETVPLNRSYSAQHMLSVRQRLLLVFGHETLASRCDLGRTHWSSGAVFLDSGIYTIHHIVL